MTDTVKGAGRRKYEANKRHAQRTPLPPKGAKEPTPTARARKIVEEEAKAVVRKRPTKKAAPVAVEPVEEVAPSPAAPERVTKAQELALAAEDAGWDVERILDGSHKTLIALRGEERLEANWDNDRSCTPLGFHEIAGVRVKFNHVTVAKRIVAVEPSVALANARTASQRKSAPRTATHRSVSSGVPFNPATSTDQEVLDALNGHRVEWRCALTDEFTGSGVIPLNGKQTKLDADDLDAPETRQLTFCDAEGGGFMTFRLSALIDVSIKSVDDGHMVAMTLQKAMLAMHDDKKGRKAS